MEHDVHHLHHHQQEQQAMELPPGFRFHPTDEELITHYLSRKAADPRFAPHAVGEADLNKCEPWDLPARATMGEKEWYFFCVKDRKYPTGLRTNRATESGYWKATGKDRHIFRGKSLVGMKKTLVFYTGRAPKGGKTGWVMHEYRLDGKHAAAAGSSSLIPSIRAGASKEEWVLCRVFKKSIEPPLVVAGGGKRSSGASMEAEDAVGPTMASMVDDLAAACVLPPLMDVSGGGGGGMSLSAAAQLPPAAQHVTCFSNTLEAGQFLNPPFLPCFSTGPAAAAHQRGTVAAAVDQLAMAASSSTFLANMYDGAMGVGSMVHELLQENGGWYSKLGEIERMSGGASQETGITSAEVNPGEISSSSRHQHMDRQASLWGY